MTQTTEMAAPPPSQPEPERPAPDTAIASVPRKPFWRRPWVVPAWLVIGAFIFYAVPNYLTFDPDTAQIPFLRRDWPAHYIMVVGHVWFGTVTMLTMCVQIWPWVRQHHPALHRWSGRIYVFGGVIPTVILAFGITPFGAGPPGNAIGGILWLAATIAGYRAARQRRYADHRRWMIYSFALTLQIVWGRVLLLVLPLFPGFNFDDPHTANITQEAISWVGFVINLLAAQFYLEWSAKKSRRRRAALAAERQPADA